MRKKTNTDQER